MSSVIYYKFINTRNKLIADEVWRCLCFLVWNVHEAAGGGVEAEAAGPHLGAPLAHVLLHPLEQTQHRVCARQPGHNMVIICVECKW